MAIDFSEYVYLVPLNPSPTDIYLDSIDYAKLVLPEFQPRQGTPEDALLQAISYISALNVAALNRLPDRLMGGLMGMMGVEINDGEKAVIDVTFTCIDHEGTLIPSGTLLRYDYEFLGEQNSLYFQTSEEATIPAGIVGDDLPTVTVEVEAVEIGVILPLLSGDELIIDTPTSNLIGAVVDSVVSRGVNPETTSDFLNRAVTFLGSLSSSFGKATQIEDYVLSEFSSTVSRCKTFDLTNATSGLEWADTDEPGYVTVFTYGINQQLTTDQKLDILLSVEERTIAGLVVTVEDVNEVPLEIEVSATHISAYESAAVEENIKSVLSTYFSPGNYRFTQSIKLSEFFAAIFAVPGVLYVESISITPGTGGSVDVDGNINFSKKGSLPSTAIADIAVTLTSLDE
jgi:hypothetical protein